jgi:hypothetical protein
LIDVRRVAGGWKIAYRKIFQQQNALAAENVSNFFQ